MTMSDELKSNPLPRKRYKVQQSVRETEELRLRRPSVGRSQSAVRSTWRPVQQWMRRKRSLEDARYTGGRIRRISSLEEAR